MKSDEDPIDRIDLAPLDPGGWKQKSAVLAARALDQRRLRRAVVVRGMTALALSAAAALALWFSAPTPGPRHDQPASSSSSSSINMLDWAYRTTDPTEALRYAQ
jgi:hypothetical protein